MMPPYEFGTHQLVSKSDLHLRVTPIGSDLWPLARMGAELSQDPLTKRSVFGTYRVDCKLDLPCRDTQVLFGRWPSVLIATALFPVQVNTLRKGVTPLTIQCGYGTQTAASRSALLWWGTPTRCYRWPTAPMVAASSPALLTTPCVSGTQMGGNQSALRAQWCVSPPPPPQWRRGHP